MKPKRPGRESHPQRRPTGVVPVRPVSREHKTIPGDPAPAAGEESPSDAPEKPKGPPLMERLARSKAVRILRSRRLHLGVAGLLFAAVLALGAYRGYRYLYHSPHFGLKHVEISPTYHVDRETLVAMAQLSHGQNLFRISLAHVKKRLSRHPWIRSVTVSRTLPDTLHIEVIEHESVAAILFSGEAPCEREPCSLENSPFYLINSDGEIFKKATPEELRGKVIITGIHRDTFHQNPRSVQRLIRRSLDFLKLYQDNPLRPELSEIHLALDVIQIFLKHSSCVIHLESSDLPRRLEHLDSLLARMDLPLEKVRIIYLDDRENPSRIVVLPEPEPEPEPAPEPGAAPGPAARTPPAMGPAAVTPPAAMTPIQ